MIYIRKNIANKNFRYFQGVRMLLASRGIGCTQTVPGAENGAGNPTFQFKRSAIENSSLFTNALGNVDAILPFRMMASSAVRQFPTTTLK